MFNLLRLFISLSSFFLFLVLEVICFSLIVKYNQQQQAVYLATINRFTTTFQARITTWKQYLNLYQENKRLARENALLLERLADLGIREPFPPDSTWIDTTHIKYRIIPARIIKNSIHNYHNYIILDKGRKHGVTPHSGVLTANGVVGIVRKVSDNFSVVMSVVHRQTKVSARLRNKGFFGPLVWAGPEKLDYFYLQDIPKHALVEKGDTVETSGYSAIFPPGIMLGTVDSIWLEPGSNYFTLQVKTRMNISQLQQVYVVSNVLKTEQDQLEQAVIQEDE